MTYEQLQEFFGDSIKIALIDTDTYDVLFEGWSGGGDSAFFSALVVYIFPPNIEWDDAHIAIEIRV